ncbi:hypothetical protein DPEC_G00065710 [Dallia pectoralis]|uniref:Uncharacterized protein n=1 Tax=Dallia pectoralis TaxID=75939 RepID=A0ACC2H8B1_DALPE|nr:hypothetical protein DPEC_G00065710 [Dallia pectoralis]
MCGDASSSTLFICANQQLSALHGSWFPSPGQGSSSCGPAPDLLLPPDTADVVEAEDHHGSQGPTTTSGTIKPQHEARDGAFHAGIHLSGVSAEPLAGKQSQGSVLKLSPPLCCAGTGMLGVISLMEA